MKSGEERIAAFSKAVALCHGYGANDAAKLARLLCEEPWLGRWTEERLRFGGSLLGYAVFHGLVEAAEALLPYSDANEGDSQGSTPLLLACSGSDNASARLVELLGPEGDWNAVNIFGASAWTRLAGNGDPRLMRPMAAMRGLDVASARFGEQQVSLLGIAVGRSDEKGPAMALEIAKMAPSLMKEFVGEAASFAKLSAEPACLQALADYARSLAEAAEIDQASKKTGQRHGVARRL